MSPSGVEPRRRREVAEVKPSLLPVGNDEGVGGEGGWVERNSMTSASESSFAGSALNFAESLSVILS